ncbi:MAG: hypothetical protein V2J14_10660 [Erythrobacter sp.]|jgi:hypothetical protein|nr:hypothetical protein [Erythrobacter sp.]
MRSLLRRRRGPLTRLRRRAAKLAVIGTALALRKAHRARRA